MHRFFVAPEVFSSDAVCVKGEQAHQMRRVLRLRPGDQVILLDGEGHGCDAVLESYGKEEAHFGVARRWDAASEPAVHITLYQAVLKGERFAWVLQKGTEIGVSRFVPLVCERNIVEDLAAIEGRQSRWERIIREAAEQSRRARLPELMPAQLFRSVVKLAASEASRAAPSPLIAWEGERSVSLRQALSGRNLGAGSRIELVVGPEGGFTDDEIATARRSGMTSFSLGPRILRAETAGPVAAALILYEAGDI
jgi:16S rRNA (uracil1498-N3)-methyltransferase